MKKTIPILLALIFLSAALLVKAQTASGTNTYQAVITWDANDYYPSDFKGKPMPTNGTNVSLSVILTQNQRLVDVSSMPILWYVDGNFLGGGVGSYQTSFRVTKTAGDYHTVMVEINTPDGQTISTSESIPVSNYLAIIDAPYPADQVQKNSTVNLEIIPYFFNVSSLNNLLFSWNVNSLQKTNQSLDNTLSLQTGSVSPQTVNVSAYIENSSNQYEFANGKINLYVQ